MPATELHTFGENKQGQLVISIYNLERTIVLLNSSSVQMNMANKLMRKSIV